MSDLNRTTTARTSRPRIAALLALVMLGATGLAACDSEGPAEQLGEKIDNTVEETGDAIENATDK
ncbi:hypothetical protein [Nisaea sp.]|uniref:hypothetical protein n=1 Tax=Nisaea sp. TaxID=2024842 RepID=UPI003297BC25